MAPDEDLPEDETTEEESPEEGTEDDTTPDGDTTTDEDDEDGTEDDGDGPEGGRDGDIDDDIDDDGPDAGEGEEDPDGPRSLALRAGRSADMLPPAPPTATAPDARGDASERDVTPPPPRQPAGRNTGLADEGDPEDMDFRETGSRASWMGDRPAPDVLERDARAGAADGRRLNIGDDPGEDAVLSPASPDMIEAVTAAIEEAELLDIYDLSVERAGGTLILRGSAATPEERDRAAELAAALPGVGRVQNLISAG